MAKERNINFSSFSKQPRNNLAETMQRGIALLQKGPVGRSVPDISTGCIT